MDNKMTASNCLNMQYELLKEMYFDNKTEKQTYPFVSSDLGSGRVLYLLRCRPHTKCR